MNRRLLATMATGLLLTSAAAALAQAPSPPAPPGHAFFDEMDSNKDGVVTRAEVTAVLDRRFAALDTDRNGTITQAERQAQRDRKWDERFAAMDSDKNGQLSPAELRAAKDRTGMSGKDAGAPPPPPGASASAYGQKHRGGWGKRHDESRGRDHNVGPDGGPGSGDVTKDVFVQRALTRFDLLDSNDDGRITAAERDAVGGRRDFPHHGASDDKPGN